MQKDKDQSIAIFTQFLLAMTNVLCAFVLLFTSDYQFNHTEVYKGLILVSHALGTFSERLFWLMNFTFLGTWQVLAVLIVGNYQDESKIWQKIGFLGGMIFWSTLCFATLMFVPITILSVFMFGMFVANARWYVHIGYPFSLTDLIKRVVVNCSSVKLTMEPVLSKFR